jgi:hypothetical protein
MPCWPPSPCDRLSRSPRRVRHFPRLLRGLRPTTTVLDPEPESSHLTRTGCRVEMNGPARWFPRSPGHRLVREAPSSTPAASPRLRRSPSPWPTRSLATAPPVPCGDAPQGPILEDPSRIDRSGQPLSSTLAGLTGGDQIIGLFLESYSVHGPLEAAWDSTTAW